MLDNEGHAEIDLDPIEFSPRSRLVRPDVFGLGSPYVESLISYIVRVAAAHNVSPIRMLKKVYGPENPDIARCMYPSFFNYYASTMNGLGKYAQMFATETKNMTGGNQLHLTTLLPLADLHPSTGCGLLFDTPYWCPECLQQMIVEQGQAYRPLIWSLKLYKFCTKHNAPLVNACPHCERIQPFIMNYPDLSRCAYCYHGLNVRCINEDIQFSELDYWVFCAIEDLVLNLPTLNQKASADSLRIFIRKVIKDKLKTNTTNFCKQIGLNGWALKGWLNNGEKPSLPQLLAVCYGMNILPSSIFIDGVRQFKSGELSLRKLPDKIVNRAERPLLKPTQKKLLINALNQYAEDPKEHRPLSAIASTLGYSASCLRYWFPRQCDQISTKHSEQKRIEGYVNQQTSIKMVEAIVDELKVNGECLSNRKVNDRLLHYGKTLAKPFLYKAFKEIRRRG